MVIGKEGKQVLTKVFLELSSKHHATSVDLGTGDILFMTYSSLTIAELRHRTSDEVHFNVSYVTQEDR